MGGVSPSVMVLVKNEQYFLPYVLKQCEDIFDSFVIYDVGSTDETVRIIDWFYERNKDYADIVIRKLPHCSPPVQGTFRNSMIIEGQRPIYFILDGSGRMEIDGVVRSVDPGDAILIPPGAWHEITATADGDLRFLCACAPPYRHEDTFFD